MSKMSVGSYAKRFVAALSIAAAVVGVNVAVEQSASASPAAPTINQVPCDRNEYTKLTYHGDHEYTACYANGGEIPTAGRDFWVDQIWTGNNRVQYFADGYWQPSQPIGKNTFFAWPNHPGGVQIELIRIV